MSQTNYDEKVHLLERRLTEMRERIAALKASAEVRAIVDLQGPRETGGHGHGH